MGSVYIFYANSHCRQQRHPNHHHLSYSKFALAALSSAACFESGHFFLASFSLPALAAFPLMLLEERIFGFDHVTKYNIQMSCCFLSLSILELCYISENLAAHQ
jgi:hypothetical protein